MQPTLLRKRPLAVQLVLAGAVPAAFGALCGWLLTVNETAYTVAAILAIGGGYFAGREHVGAGEGALRGLVGGVLFGGFIFLVYKAIDKPAKADLPDPEVLLIAVTAVFGVGLGAMGGAARKRKEEEEEDEEEKPAFSLKRIKAAEFIGFAGAIVLAFSLFALPWFETSCSNAGEARVATKQTGGCNPKSKIKLASGRVAYGSYSAWKVYKFVRWPLLLACIAPFILAYIIARGHALSWRPGEVTMIVGIIAVTLILLDGIILGRPGSGHADYTVDISIKIGYLVGLIGTFLMAYGGFRRQAEDIQKKPPGV